MNMLLVQHLLLQLLAGAPGGLLRAAGAALPVGVWNTTISGVPNSQLADAPSLGNGYAGIVLADGPFDSLPLLRTVDLWLNTNANWGCGNNTATGIPGRLTPAVCSMVGFGGVSFAVPALLGGGAEGEGASFHAEQRMAGGHLYTRQAAAAGAVETLTYVHPERNVIVTNVTWTGPAPARLEVRAWVYNTSAQAHGEPTAVHFHIAPSLAIPLPFPVFHI
jgi:hypothetical protein